MTMLKLALVLSMGVAGTAAVAGADENQAKGPGAAPAAGHIMVTPKELTWTDPPPGLPKGAKVAVLEGDLKQGPFTVRIQFPSKFRIMPHTHPTMEHVTVLSGAVNMGMSEKFDEKASMKLPAGAFAAMPPNTAHYLWTSEKAVVQVHGIGPFVINYVNPQDDPRNQTAAPAAPSAK